MTDQLFVQSETRSWELPLPRQRLRLGSDRASELCILHPEVARQAATIDWAGDMVLISNHNEYPIYVGVRRLDSGGMTEWPDSDEVRLTANVVLRLQRAAAANGKSALPNQAAVAADSQGGKSSRQTVQIAVITICGLLALVLMLNEEPAARGRSSVSYDGLAARMTAAISSERDESTKLELQRILSALREAHRIEARSSSPHDLLDAEAAYGRIINSSLVRSAGSDPQSIGFQVREFSAARKQEINETLTNR